MKITLALRTASLVLMMLPFSAPATSASANAPTRDTTRPAATSVESRIVVDPKVEAAAHVRRNRRAYSRGGYSSGGLNQALPGGRRYYGGRYFGNFNNRYYGPQYGYF